MTSKPRFALWTRFQTKHPELARFFVFFMISNGVTVLQLVLMPAFRWAFDQTTLVATSFQIWPVGFNTDGSQHFIFDYPAGQLPAGGGGLAYFLAVQITIGIAQVVNFFAQRSITFRSTSSIWRAACWYAVAYVAITLFAAAAQGFYKAPIYRLLMETWGWGATGGTVADLITMLINATISFWVFYPIFKWIFRPVVAEPTTERATTEVTSG
ncbi:MAG: hypothetical protein LBJ62_05625 [Bifidobacteriaceae bacterium]|jgi:hypothetical protein|nr:hypothetical protein [Bifidobacteriaceae bacterium]